MPRKRATRAQTTRAKPKLESLGDDIVNGMAPSERAAKLQSFIEEFDFKVEAMRQKLKEELKHIEDYQIKKSYYHIRLSLSTRERGLTVAEYIAESQEKEKDAENVQPEPEKTRTQTVLDTLSKYKTRKIEPILEEEGGELTVKKPRKGAKAKAGSVTFNADPTPFTNKYVTPATARNASALGWNTPLVTPKFDPRLPITPAQTRRPHEGEVVMSLAGSPIAVNASGNSRTRTLQMTISEDNEGIEDLEIPDNVSLETVMSLLSNVMKKKGKAKK